MLRLVPTATFCTRARLVAACLAAALVGRGAPAHAQPAAPAVDPALLAGLRWRFIGPTRGGRVTAVAGVPSAPNTFYFGATGGGVWKTEDAGTTWRNLTDGFLGEG